MEQSGPRDGGCAEAASIAALAQAAGFGPYFATDAWTPDGRWQPLTDLLEPATLDAEVRRTLAALAGDERMQPRVAASTLHLGLVARLTAPLLGAAVAAHGIPDLSADTVWWRVGAPGARPVATSPVPVLAAAPATLAAVIERVTGPLCTGVGERYAVSRQVLWGNVASSLAAASRVIGDRGEARALAGGALEHGALRGTLDDAGRRRSCCLFYRVPDGGYCGDCVLTG
ncbi:(2Fe-2S)-binding protein [Leekyejoonella antrihumi]|uniref:(2Fe-2S)-binding protein n=1 Tax=Leekyejoonella antrihumi TaxID=1660198 RepID=A0A563E065_9MICO|nr:(2Fe-2S)-binding protein [Leekyejoonella antrihumi]TWP35572.1 (2Fe-2S)-binding protein [Leekyejoonella antrihumi]